MVWTEPIRTIATRLGVSDVGLTKACKRSDIPTPERGYWAKLAHGKPVRQPPLPKRPDLPDRVIVAPQATKPQQPAAAKAVIEETKIPDVAVPRISAAPIPPCVSGSKTTPSAERITAETVGEVGWLDLTLLAPLDPDAEGTRTFCALFPLTEAGSGKRSPEPVAVPTHYR